MAPREAVEARPRSTVEILDDAWRTAFADAPLLLSLSALFILPALTCLLALLCQPLPDAWWARLWLPALTALLLPLTGLSSGACQEAFHSWAEGYPIRVGESLRAAAQRGLNHLASQALAVIVPLTLVALVVAPALSPAAKVVLVLLMLPAWFFWSVFGLSRQPSFAAGQQRFWRGFRYAFRASGWHFGRACLLQVVRGLVFLFALFNFHLFWRFALWVAGDLAGFDVALLGVLCSLGNPVYLLALVGLT